MAVCSNCKKASGLLALAFPDRRDRAHMLASAIAMRNTVAASDKPGAADDRKINAGVIVKLINSFPAPQRAAILDGFQSDLQVQIIAESCPHSSGLEIVS